MSTHNICFHGEIRKIFTGYPPLSRSMVSCFFFPGFSSYCPPLMNDWLDISEIDLKGP